MAQATSTASPVQPTAAAATSAKVFGPLLRQTAAIPFESSDGKYLSITAGYSSSSVTLTNEPQVLTITELGDAFAISYNGVYLDRYSSAFIAAYPGNANENEQWQLYKPSLTPMMLPLPQWQAARPDL